MKSYQFQDQEVQAEWFIFGPETYAKLKAIRARIPEEVNARSRNLEKLIEDLMDVRFDVADWLAKCEEFENLAHGEALTKLYELNPKMSVTILKEQAGAQVANVVALHAFCRHVFSSIESATMSAMSLLRKAP